MARNVQARFVGFDKLQFPKKEVDEYEQQIKEIQEEVHAATYEHEGKTAEQAYEDKLASIFNLAEGEVQDGITVVKALLMRCTLWIEIMREKYVPNKYLHFDTTSLTRSIDKAKSTNASKTTTTNSSKSATNWSK